MKQISLGNLPTSEKIKLLPQASFLETTVANNMAFPIFHNEQENHLSACPNAPVSIIISLPSSKVMVLAKFKFGNINTC